MKTAYGRQWREKGEDARRRTVLLGMWRRRAPEETHNHG
ncbi:hypothetical protein A2U01_0092087, partial [Trifolium medium]|nr:hypothetical protein [Trifolium medium]